jgi:hypothetical protein
MNLFSAYHHEWVKNEKNDAGDEVTFFKPDVIHIPCMRKLVPLLSEINEQETKYAQSWRKMTLAHFGVYFQEKLRRQVDEVRDFMKVINEYNGEISDEMVITIGKHPFISRFHSFSSTYKPGPENKQYQENKAIVFKFAA